MKTKFLGALIMGAVFLARAADMPLMENQREAGLRSLFNGRDLTGWDGNPKLWSVKEGAITGQTTAEDPIKGNTFLIWTNGNVQDFEFRCSFKIQPKSNAGFANSGIQYRSQILDSNNWVVGGYQADMEAGPTYTGILYEERMSRAIMAARGEKVVWDKDCQKKVVGSLGKSEDLQAAIKQGDWNQYVIVAQGNHLQHFINGKQTVDVVDECEAKRATNGVLALQLHAGQPMMVQFKDLRLKAGPAMAGNQTGDTPESELAKIQGAWRAVKAEENGSALPSEDIADLVVMVSKNSYQLIIGGENQDHGTFTMDPAKHPKEMDVRPESGADEGRRLLAIYELSPDTLRVCYARQGGPRPKSFDTADDSQLFAITYERKK